MTRYGYSEKTGTVVVALGSEQTQIQSGLFDRYHNPKNTFYEDELQVWYILLTTQGSPLSGKTIHLRWGALETTAVTGAGGDPGYAIVQIAAYEWGFIGTMTVQVQFDGDDTYAAASTSETFTILMATSTPTEIRYSLTDGTNTEKTRFNPTDHIRWYVQLVIAGSYTPVNDAEIRLEIEVDHEEQTIFTGKTNADGWLPLIEILASDLGVGTWNWRLHFDGMVILQAGRLSAAKRLGMIAV